MSRESRKKYYITTPIYYINDLPHTGHAYTTIAADVLARYHRLIGEDVCFLTGTDENSQKNLEAAKKAGAKNLKTYLNKMSGVWKKTWSALNITNTDFIRTTEKRHLDAVKKFFELVWGKGDIYEGVYEGWYCVPCEAFVPDSDLVDGKCPQHLSVPQKIKEKNLFFRASKYRDAILSFIEENPNFISPAARQNEVVSFIRDFMADFSISREKGVCGIPMPKIAKQKKESVLYVWFDALINYISALDFGKAKSKKFEKFWPADLHLVGKDIIKFHCAYWPAMLLSAGLPLPKQIFSHGFFTVDGQKMSKTLKNVIDPKELAKKYGVDVLRYFLMREISFGEDGDFSLKRLEERYNADLAHGLGNLVARVLGMTEKFFNGKVPPATQGSVLNTWESYTLNLQELNLHLALQDIWDLISWCDKFIDTEQPWTLAKIDKYRLSRVLYTLLEALRHIAWLLLPFMPETAEKIFTQLGIFKIEKKKKIEQARIWGGLKPGTKIKKGPSLFPTLN